MSGSLFEDDKIPIPSGAAPLADRMRPQTLDEVYGQGHLLDPGKPLRTAIERDQVPLAGTRTKVSHVASTTHRQLDDEALAAAGIRPGTVRLSVGLEDPEDLIADVVQALDGLDT